MRILPNLFLKSKIMTLVLTPADQHIFKTDLKKEISKYETNAANFLHIAKLQSGKKPVLFEIEGEICTSGITCTDFGTDKKKKPVYSIGIKVNDEDSFEPLRKLLEETCTDGSWEILRPVREDKIYFKLKLDGTGKKFNFKSNIPLTPKKFAEAANSTNLHVEGEVSAWFNFEEKTTGLLFTPKCLTFDEEDDDDESEVPPPPSKKRRGSQLPSIPE